jgi:hypothetical protein
MHGSHGMKTVLLICFESLRLDGGSGLYLFVLGKLGKITKRWDFSLRTISFSRGNYIVFSFGS